MSKADQIKSRSQSEFATEALVHSIATAMKDAEEQRRAVIAAPREVFDRLPMSEVGFHFNRVWECVGAARQQKIRSIVVRALRALHAANLDAVEEANLALSAFVRVRPVRPLVRALLKHSMKLSKLRKAA